MTSFLRVDNTYRAFNSNDIETSHELPSGNYLFRYDEDSGARLEKTNSFIMPDKIYGSVDDRTKRVLHTFQQRSNQTTGVLLSGYKGSGKTLLARSICIQSKLPVIIIDNPYNLVMITDMLSTITTPFLLLIDEFEKKYPAGAEGRGRDLEEQQKAMASFLSFLDGTSNHQRMVVLTVNDSIKVNIHLLSRPGRIFYHYRYTGMTNIEIMSYLKDNLVDQTKLQTLFMELQSLSLTGSLTFDILQAVVEEVNRYPSENPVELLKAMNVGSTDETTFDTYCIVDDVKVDFRGRKTFTVNPFDLELYIRDDIFIPSVKRRKDGKVVKNEDDKDIYSINTELTTDDFLYIKDGLFFYKCNLSPSHQLYNRVMIVLQPKLIANKGWMDSSSTTHSPLPSF